MQNTIKNYWKWVLAASIPMVLFGYFYPSYIKDNTFFWMCVITLPLSAQRSANSKGFSAFWIAIILGTLSMLLPTTIGLYTVMCLMLIMLLQQIVGSLHLTLLVHVLLASPFFTYFNSLVSFPIRLYLSKIVTTILQGIGMDVHIEGNLVYMNDSSFLVDEACAGMAMFGYGLLFGTIILTQLSKNKRLNLQWVTLFYAVLLALIFSGNIIRITLLIVFQIMPNHWLHEGVGFCIYAFQILIPFYLVTSWTLKRKVTNQHLIKLRWHAFPYRKYAMLLILFVTILIQHQIHPKESVNSPSIKLSGFTSETVKGEVTKLKSQDALIYIKPPVSPYRADHNPMICWQGSGYSFKKIDQWDLQGTPINHAELVKKQDKIYTAWWFQSQNYATSNQLEWRKYGLFENEKFYLINVTCNSIEELKTQVSSLLHQNIIAQNQITYNHDK